MPADGQMKGVAGILGLAALVSLGLMLWQWWLGMRVRRRPPTAPAPPAPGVTVLKPLKGCDSHTRECLQSWLAQRYPGPVQVLFGVADRDDPVCDVARRAIADAAGVDAQLVICAKRLGANAKVSTLVQLARLARHQLLVVTDADVWASPEVLAGVASAFDKGTGLVSCLYAEATPANVWMRLEAVAINADFWTQVLQARALGKMDFALGAVMALRTAALARIGGFEALVDHLADDYELGHRIAATGSEVRLCPTVVECRSDPMSARQVWAHQVRWARTIRVCQPVQYFFSLLGNATLWTGLFAVVGGMLGLGLFLGGLAFRMVSAAVLQKRLTSRGDHLAWFFLPPVKDLFGVAVWAAAFLGNTVEWRGRRYRVGQGGKLAAIN